MAAFCVELKMSPAEYWALKADEFDALINELKDRKKEQAKAARGG